MTNVRDGGRVSGERPFPRRRPPNRQPSFLRLLRLIATVFVASAGFALLLLSRRNARSRAQANPHPPG